MKPLWPTVAVASTAPGPGLLGVVKKFGNGDVEPGGPEFYVENHLHVLGALAAQHVVLDGARVKFLADAPRHIFEHGGIQLFADQRRRILAQTGAELAVLVAIGDQVGAPPFRRDHHRLHRVARIDVEFGVLRSGGEQAAQKQQAAQPGVFHAATLWHAWRQSESIEDREG